VKVGFFFALRTWRLFFATFAVKKTFPAKNAQDSQSAQSESWAKGRKLSHYRRVLLLARPPAVRYFQNQPLLALMEHSCHKCGNPVEDGVAFCAHCGAPQIRVALADSEPEQSIPGAPPPPSIASTTSPFRDRTGPSQVIYWAHGLPAAALAGVIAAVGMMFVGIFGGLAAGFLAVLLYRRRTQGGLLFPRAGARLGAVSGVLGFAIFALITVPTGLLRTVLEAILKFASQRSDAQLQALTERWLETLKTPGGLAAWLISVFVFLILASAVGGALGGAILSRRGRQGPFSW